MAVVSLFTELGGTPDTGGTWSATSYPYGGSQAFFTHRINGGSWTQECLTGPGGAAPTVISTPAMTNPHLVDIELEGMNAGTWVFTYDISNLPGAGGCGTPTSQTVTVEVEDAPTNERLDGITLPICRECSIVNGGTPFTIDLLVDSYTYSGNSCGFSPMAFGGTINASWRRGVVPLIGGAGVTSFEVGVDGGSDINDPATWPDNVLISYPGTSCGFTLALPITAPVQLNVCMETLDATYCYNTALSNNQIYAADVITNWDGSGYEIYYLGKNGIPLGTPTLLYSGGSDPRFLTLPINVQGSSDGDVLNYRFVATESSNIPPCDESESFFDLTIEHIADPGSDVTDSQCYA